MSKVLGIHPSSIYSISVPFVSLPQSHWATAIVCDKLNVDDKFKNIKVIFIWAWSWKIVSLGHESVGGISLNAGFSKFQNVVYIDVSLINLSVLYNNHNDSLVKKESSLVFNNSLLDLFHLNSSMVPLKLLYSNHSKMANPTAITEVKKLGWLQESCPFRCLVNRIVKFNDCWTVMSFKHEVIVPGFERRSLVVLLQLNWM
jgi:hypothetical protein